jgi:hypothetical protein
LFVISFPSGLTILFPFPIFKRLSHHKFCLSNSSPWNRPSRFSQTVWEMQSLTSISSPFLSSSSHSFVLLTWFYCSTFLVFRSSNFFHFDWFYSSRNSFQCLLIESMFLIDPGKFEITIKFLRHVIWHVLDFHHSWSFENRKIFSTILSDDHSLWECSWDKHQKSHPLQLCHVSLFFHSTVCHLDCDECFDKLW